MVGHRVKRKLAAIMAVDVVGYSHLMGEDETGTLQRLKALRTSVIEPAVAEYGGRIVKLMGDGLIAEFPSVVDAAQSALWIQTKLKDRKSDQLQRQQLELRIGVNLGDVIVEGDDIYGDGVNVAARLEGIAAPGNVCISGASFDTISGKFEFDFEDLGFLDLKNIKVPVRVVRIAPPSGSAASKSAPLRMREPRAKHRTYLSALALTLAGAVGVAGVIVFLQFDRSDSSKVLRPGAVPKLAVLPFENLSSDASQTYFAQGIAADLIVDLSKLRGIVVISRRSSFAFPNAKTKLNATARKLGVRYIISGSVRRHVGLLRINAQLIDTAKDVVVWGHRFDGTTKDIFRFQDQIVGQIVSQLRKKLSPGEEAAITQRGTSSPEAHDAFLLGMRLNASQRDLDTKNNKAAIAAFREAIRIDPKYARAIAGLAWAHWLNYTMIHPDGSGIFHAFDLAEKSLKLKKNALAYRIIAKKHFSLGLAAEPK